MCIRDRAEAIYQKDHPNFKLNIEENVYSDIETKLITAATSEDYSTLPDIFLMQDYSCLLYTSVQKWTSIDNVS